MGARRRRSIGATVLCIAAVVAVPAQLSAATPTTTSTIVEAPTAALGPVTVHEIESPAVGGSGSSMTQVVQIAVIGGDLTLVTPQAEVELRRGPWSIWTGELPAVRVIDARGTHAGWTVRWDVAQVATTASGRTREVTGASAVWLAPSGPVVVAGLPDGLTSGRDGRVLFAAEPGGGGGTYEAGGQVAVLVPPTVDPSAVVVRLTFALG